MSPTKVVTDTPASVGSNEISAKLAGLPIGIHGGILNLQSNLLESQTKQDTMPPSSLTDFTTLIEHGDEVEQEQWLDREQWFVLRAKVPGVSARALARNYRLEELRDYLTRSREEIDKMRGQPLSSATRISSKE